MMHEVYLGLGSNLGDRHALMEKAVMVIGERIGKVVRQSSFIETEPWGFESDNRFLNAVVLVATELTPREVLAQTQLIEKDLGKTKEHATERTPRYSLSTSLSTLASPRYKDRPIDIDILLYDDVVIDEPDLKVPHPHMHERDFVMKPLEEVRGKGEKE